MSLYDSLRKALTPELFTQVTDALGDDFDYDVVPRARLNKVIKQRNDLRDQLAGNTQAQRGTSKTDEDDDELNTGKSAESKPVNVAELRAQLLRRSEFSMQHWKSCVPLMSLILS